MNVLYVKALAQGAVVPTRSNPTDAGLDLYAATDKIIRPSQRELISTKIAISIPDGHVGLIKPRSGLAMKHGIDVMAGVIDSSYRGEVMVLLVNLGYATFFISPGDRIAQLLIQKVEFMPIMLVDELDDTDRGSGGFGSSGR